MRAAASSARLDVDDERIMSCVIAWRATGFSRMVGSASRATGSAGDATVAGDSVLTVRGIPSGVSSMKGVAPLLNCTCQRLGGSATPRGVIVTERTSTVVEGSVMASEMARLRRA